MSDLTQAHQIQIAREATRTALDPSLAAIAAEVNVSREQSNSPALATRLKPECRLDPQLDAAERAALDLQLATDAQALTELSRQDSNVSSSALDIPKPLEPATPSQESTLPSPSTRERLPSISQLTQQLTTHSLPALAEAATQQEARLSHHHSHSYSSNGAQSPTLNHHQPSPVSFAAFPAGTARSPTSAMAGDTPYYQSPQMYAPYTFYGHRRPSATDQGMPLPPSLPSASSSGDSAGTGDSNIDGYSTAHTTPIEPSQSIDTTPRAVTTMLPPPPAGGYKCTYEGCTAQPFQTQYLLTSHKNVHSQDRPHYCPVKDCPRGEGGKGFKRKNEMIRHGLVHKSPGYICPFCPDREHKYPRPDNLQRHVRVHHVNKDRDDPLLQEVLNQRTEGQGKTRRGRTTITTIIAAPT